MFMASRVTLASSSDMPPERNVIPGSATWEKEERKGGSEVRW